MQYEIILAYLALVVSCLSTVISLITWLGFDRRHEGPRFWTLSFLLYMAEIILSVSGRGHGLYSLNQVPLLAILCIANWMQYLGFRSFFCSIAAWSRPASWLVVGIVAVTCSGASFCFRSPVVTFLIQQSLGILCVFMIMLLFLKRRDSLGRSVQRTIFGILALSLVVMLWGFANLFQALLSSGLMAKIPTDSWIYGPAAWFACLILLAIMESQLVAAYLLKDRSRALEQSESDRKVLASMATELQHQQRDMLSMMGLVFEKRTVETAGHVDRVAELTKRLAIELGFSAEQAGLISDASRLHDIGKVGVPDRILKSTDLLTEMERQEMAQHTKLGYQILSRSPTLFFQLAASIAHEHHERWDGLGYPRGLSGGNISSEARIVAVADTFDALISLRSYKEPWDWNRAIGWVMEHSGSMFDPAVVEAFHRLNRNGTLV